MKYSQNKCSEVSFDELKESEVKEVCEGDFSLAFEGAGSEGNFLGNCTGCGNKYFFAVKFAV